MTLREPFAAAEDIEIEEGTIGNRKQVRVCTCYVTVILYRPLSPYRILVLFRRQREEKYTFVKKVTEDAGNRPERIAENDPSGEK